MEKLTINNLLSKGYTTIFSFRDASTIYNKYYRLTIYKINKYGNITVKRDNNIYTTDEVNTLEYDLRDSKAKVIIQ